MRNGREVMKETTDQIAGYLPRLEALVAERPSPAGVPVRPGRPAHAPLPGSTAALLALMSAHAGARHAEDLLLYDRAGRATRGRGGSDANTAQALKEIPKLSAGASDDAFRLAISELDARLREIQCVPGVDEARRYSHLGRDCPCPYCGAPFLVADRDAGVVACSMPGCLDGDGHQPFGVLGMDEIRRALLTWQDGRTQVGPVLSR